jgi:glycosyltransferase involved in cell wall biosynthesis
MELSNVSFLGWVTELPAVLAQVDLLVHPALHEGVPNVVLEAAALGCSVMVSDIPEHAEIIHDPSARVHPAHSLLWADALGRFVTEGAFQSQLRAVSSELAVQLSFPWEERALSIVEKAGRGGL